MSKGLLGIEVSERLIRYVYLVREKGKYLIQKAGEVLSPDDLSKPDVLSRELKGILQEHQLFPERISVALSRWDTVIHQNILPKMNPAEMEEAVAGEIEKIPVFYEAPFDYIFKSYPYDVGKNNVILSAISSQSLNTLIKEIQKTGIFFRDLDIVPLNLPELLASMRPSRESQAFILLQDRHSCFGVFENHQYKSFYQSPIGLNQFTKAESPVAQARVLSNWTAEIKRVMKSYLLSNPKTKLELVWLVWDKTKIPDLDKNIASALEVEVEVLYSRKIPGIKVDEENYLNPMYALALTPLIFHIQKIKAHFPLNHFFQPMLARQYMVKAAAVSLITLALGLAILAGVVRDIRTQRDYLIKATAMNSQRIEELTQESQPLFQRHENYIIVRKKLLDQATYVKKLNRVSWTEVLSIAAKEFPEDMALTSFRFNENGDATLQGDAMQMESISDLLRRVKTSAILQDGKFGFLQQKAQKKQKYYNFGILAKLKKEEKDK